MNYHIRIIRYRGYMTMTNRVKLIIHMTLNGIRPDVMSGTLRCSKVLLNHGGDRQSVVHSLIGWCAKGGLRCWLQLVRCPYLQSGV